MLKLKNLLTVIIWVLMLSGCGSMGNPVSLMDFKDIKALPYNTKLNISVAEHDLESDWAKSPFSQEGGMGRINNKKLNTMWVNIINEGVPLTFVKNNPKYFFDIKLFGIMAYGFPRSGGPIVGVDYHGGTIFHLTVKNDRNEKIYSNYFKTYGYWLAKGTSVRGPGKLNMYGAKEAVVKLGIYDILSFICREDFLNNTSNTIEKNDHILPGMTFKLPTVKVFSHYMIAQALSDNPTPYYHEDGAVVAYFRFIAGENYTSTDQLISVPWKEARSYDSELILKLAKLAHDKEWPLFPPKLKSSINKLPYTFE